MGFLPSRHARPPGLIDRSLQAVLGAARSQMERVPFGFAVSWPGGWLGPRQPELHFHFQRRGMLRALARGDLGRLAEDFVRGQIDLRGSVRLVTELMAALAGTPTDAGPRGPVGQWLRLQRSRRHHLLRRDARQIEFHYDVSDAFYALWLDPRRVYSCAYWPRGVSDLASAQEAKLDLICRKLRLQPGQRFLDIGAGWGALLLWAAERYGVTAHGVTLSRHQHAHVQRLIDERGLQGRVRIELLDYRAIAGRPWARERFDRIASVGMFEHVGVAQLPGYFRQLHDLLAPGGLVLNHGITNASLHNQELGAGIGDFIERHIFPGGELVHVSRVAAGLCEAGLELLDLENLRPHYARTLWAWSDALESQLDEAAGLVAPTTLRAYRLYLAGCAMAFERGWLSLNQLLAARPDGRVDPRPGRRLRGAQSDYPFERGDVHAPSPTIPAPAYAAETAERADMLYKFKSKAAGDVIMTAPIGDRILRLAGREPAPQGIFEVDALPSAIAALEAAIAAEEALRRAAKAEAEDDGQGKPEQEVIGLRQRAWPLIEMMRRAHSGRQPIVWGV